MKLTAGKPTFSNGVLHVDFTDRDTGKIYPMTMNEEGTFTPDHGLAVRTALENWEDFTEEPSGKLTHDDWREQLKESNRRTP